MHPPIGEVRGAHDAARSPPARESAELTKGATDMHPWLTAALFSCVFTLGSWRPRLLRRLRRGAWHSMWPAGPRRPGDPWARKRLWCKDSSAPSGWRGWAGWPAIGPLPWYQPCPHPHPCPARTVCADNCVYGLSKTPSLGAHDGAGRGSRPATSLLSANQTSLSQ